MDRIKLERIADLATAVAALPEGLTLKRTPPALCNLDYRLRELDPRGPGLVYGGAPLLSKRRFPTDEAENLLRERPLPETSKVSR